jgi:hypothetical protein
MTDDGGQAFPVSGSEYNTAYFGMTLRDHFAAAALQGWLSTLPEQVTEPDIKNPIIMARLAYKIADAMIAARKSRQSA